jgi:uncharacterized repeat protein (TIGR01451 family)
VANTTFNWTVSVSPEGSVTGASEDSGSTIAQTLTNTTALPATVTYTITPEANGCYGDPIDVTITVNPKPTLSGDLTSAVCSGTPFTYTPESNTPGTTFSWTRAAVIGISNTAGSGAHPGEINETLVNTTGTAKQVIYRYTLSANSCTNIEEVTVTVYPAPTLSSSTNPPAVCSNSPFTYNATPGIAGTTFSWSREVVAGISNEADSGEGSSITETLINTTPDEVVVPYTITMEIGGCENTQTVFVTVKPTPVLSTDLTPEPICSGELFSYEPDSETEGTTFTWQRANMAGIEPAGNTGTGNPNETLTNTTDEPIDVIYIYTLRANQCAHTEYVIIRVNPTPTVDFIDDQEFCSGTVVSEITVTGPVDGSSFTWTNDNSAIGLAASGTGNISPFTAENTTGSAISATITITPEANDCPGTPFSYTITVYPESVGGSVGEDAVVCSGSNSGTLTLTGHTGNIIRWESSTDDGSSWAPITNTSTTQSYSDLTTTTWYRAVIKNRACDETYSVPAVITVHPQSDGGTASSSHAICYENMPNDITLNDYVGDIQWQWSYDNVSFTDMPGSNSETLSGAEMGTLTAEIYYRAEVTSGICAPDYSNSVTVSVNPVPELTGAAQKEPVCENNPAEINLTGLVSNTDFSVVYAIDGGTSVTVENISADAMGEATFSTTTLNASDNGKVLVITEIIITSNTPACSKLFSESVVLEVFPESIGGIASVSENAICFNHSATINLSGYNGEIQWQQSPDGVSDWVNVTGGTGENTEEYTTANLNSDIWYRAEVTNGACAPGYSNIVEISVNPLPTLTGIAQNAIVCDGNPATVNLFGLLPGAIFSVVYTIDGGSTVTVENISSDGSGNAFFQTESLSVDDDGKTLMITNLTITGSEPYCSQNFSETIQLQIDDASFGGTIEPVDPVCVGNNPEDLVLTSYTGTIIEWQKSTDPLFASFVQIAETGSVLSGTSIGPISETTYFRAVVQNGNCQEVFSEVAEVIVNPIPELISSLNPPGICSHSVFTYAHEFSVEGTTFEWIRPQVPGINNEEGFSNEYPPDELLFNTTNSTIEVTYYYTLEANGCSNTQEVKVMVTPTPELTSPTTLDPICSGDLFSYNPTSNLTSDVNYNWVRQAQYGNAYNSGSGPINETLINNTTETQAITYTYTLSANNCTNPNSVTVSVPVIAPPQVTANASEAELCAGYEVDLTSSSSLDLPPALPQTLLNEGFGSSFPSGWNRESNSTGWGAEIAAWNPYNNSGNYVMLSNSDAHYYGTTDERLISPALNTTGYLSLELTFQHYYRDVSAGYGDYAYVQVSTNGTTWQIVRTYNSTQGTLANFSDVTIDLTAYINQPELYIRFRYYAPWGYYWLVDNVSVVGTPQSSANVVWTSNTSDWTSTEINPTNVPVIEPTTFTVTYTDPDTGCEGSDNVFVDILPSTVVPDQEITICSGETFTVSPQDGDPGTVILPGTTYSWSAPSVNPAGGISGTSAQSNQSEISQTLTNSTSDVKTVTYTVSSTNSQTSCVGEFTITVTVNPVPLISMTTTFHEQYPGNPSYQYLEICDGQSVYNVEDNDLEVFMWRSGAWRIPRPSDFAGYTTIWEYSLGTDEGPWLNAEDVEGGYINFDKFEYKMPRPPSIFSPPGDYYFRFYLENNYGCRTYSDIIHMRIVSDLIVDAGGPDFICASPSPGEVSLADSDIGGTSYTTKTGRWEIVSGGGTLLYGGNPYNGAALNHPLYKNVTYVPDANYSGTVVLALTSNDPDGPGEWNCRPVTGEREIIIEALPVTPQVEIIQPDCDNPNGTITVISPIEDGMTYSLDGITYQSGTGFTNVSPGSYSISAQSALGCLSDETVVEIDEQPPTPVVGDQTVVVCSGETFAWTPAGTPESTTYTWSEPAGTGFSGGTEQVDPVEEITFQLINETISPVEPVIAVYTITPKTGECTGESFLLTVTINPVATVFAGNDRAVCAGSLGFSLEGVIGGAATSAEWSGGTGTFNPNENTLDASYIPSAAEITAGTVTLTLTSNDPDEAGPCLPVSSSVTFDLSDIIIITPEITEINCYGNLAAIELAVSGGAEPYQSFEWNKDGNPFASIQNIDNLGPGEYVVLITDANNCTETETIIIIEPELLEVSTNYDIILCAGDETIVTVTVTGGTAPYTVSWDGGAQTETIENDGEQAIIQQPEGIVEYTITDANGCIETISVEATVAENTPPEITQCPASFEFEGCSTDDILTETGLVYSETEVEITETQFTDAGGVATDNCAVTSWRYIDVVSSEPDACPIVVTRTFIVEDAGGLTNETACEQIITITDETDPTFTVPDDFTVYKDADCNYDISEAITGEPTDVADICDPSPEVTFTDSDPVEGSCAGELIITRTWTVTDNCGNATSLNQIITVSDNIVPTFTAPAAITINAENNCGYDAGVGVTGDVTDEADNCDTNMQVTYSDDIDNTNPCEIIITRTWSLVDACGNAAGDQVQIITVIDDTPPVFTRPPDTEVYTDPACGYDASPSEAGDVFDETDNCSTGLEVTYSDVLDDTDPCNITITRTWSLADDCGNAAENQVQTILVRDLNAPVITCPPNEAIAYGTDPVPAVTGEATALDDCDNDPNITYSDIIIDGACTGNYEIRRTWTVTDQCGNEDYCTQSIFVQDIELPEITCLVVDNQTVEANSGDQYIHPDGSWDATVVENTGVYTLNATLSGATESGPHENTLENVVFEEGVTNVTWTAVDDCGNPATCTFTVTVNASADLSIVKTANPETAVTGEELVYTLEVSNAGPSAAQNTVIEDNITVFTNPEYALSTSGPWEPWTGNFTLTNPLAVGETFNLYIRGTVPVDQCEDITNSARVSSDNADYNMEDNEVTLVTPVTDNQPPVISGTLPDFEECVDMLYRAVYDTDDVLRYLDHNGASPDPYLIDNTATEDFFLFISGNPGLDLDLDAIGYTDNCCLPTDDYSVEWTINFDVNTPNIATGTSISSTGQPSTHFSDIKLWGDRVNYTTLHHTITYWIKDCHGNESLPVTRDIYITPRPKITKMP